MKNNYNKMFKEKADSYQVWNDFTISTACLTI